MKNGIVGLGIVIVLTALLVAGYMFGNRTADAPDASEAAPGSSAPAASTPGAAQPAGGPAATSRGPAARPGAGARQSPPAGRPPASPDDLARIRETGKKGSQRAEAQQVRDTETSRALAGSTVKLGERAMTMSEDGNLMVDGEPAGSWKVVNDEVYLGTSDGVTVQGRMKDGQLVGSDGAVLSGK